MAKTSPTADLDNLDDEILDFQLVRVKTLNCCHNGMRLLDVGDYIFHVRTIGVRGHTMVGRNLRQPP